VRDFLEGGRGGLKGILERSESSIIEGIGGDVVNFERVEKFRVLDFNLVRSD